MLSCSPKTALHGLLLTGNDHPAHLWKETSPLIKSILEEEGKIRISVIESVNLLGRQDMSEYDFLILNYANWEDSAGIDDASKKALIDFLGHGGGLMVLHFSNGAFHYSLPEAGASDWPEYRQIVKRVWDHTEGYSAHDNYGPLKVEVKEPAHFITMETRDFDTMDELYFNQRGDTSLLPLFTAKSVKTGKDEPLAWTYYYGEARIFQSLLGHGKESYSNPEYRKILRKAAFWVSGKNH